MMTATLNAPELLTPAPVRSSDWLGANVKSKFMDKILIARKAILDDLKRRAKAGDKAVKPNSQWSTPYGEEDRGTNYYSGAGEMSCPVCNQGKLRYSRSSYNGHVHARCSTENCVAWME